MKQFILLLFFTFSITTLVAQKRLSQSRTSSLYTYVYKLDAAGIKLFYAPDEADLLDDRILYHPVDSFLTDHPKKLKLPAGNYVQVVASDNALNYQLIENHTANLRLMDDMYSIRFILLDDQQHPITDAVVYVGSKRVTYNQQSSLYQLKKTKRDTLLKISYHGVDNYYRINSPYRPRAAHYAFKTFMRNRWHKFIVWYKNTFKAQHHYNRYEDVPSNPGYIVFNKPKYRLDDTVKFKAFVLGKKSKKPIGDTRLLVRLKDDKWDNGKIIGYVDAYRPGAFSYEFKLSDSLKLTLDDDYYISLETLDSKKIDLDQYEDDHDEDYLAKRTVYQQGLFHYEDYELSTNQNSLRLDSKNYSPGLPVSIYLKSTDDNGLSVPDGRVKLSLTAGYISAFANNHEFVPDTLWQHTFKLDPVGETKLAIPDSIFKKVNFEVNVSAQFLNSNNESDLKEDHFNYVYNNKQVKLDINYDTLKATYTVAGKEKKATGNLYTLGSKNDTLSIQQMSLPAYVLINQNVAGYLVKVDGEETEIKLGNDQANVSPSGYRTADSMFVDVANPRHLNFWYTIYKGNQIFEQGTARTLRKKWPFKFKESASVLVNYLWGGMSQREEIRVPYQDKILKINVKQPLTVYPGQTANIQINVKDDTGKPVQGADLTAYSLTRKFTEYAAPNVPYLGKVYPDRKYNNLSRLSFLRNTNTMQLNWRRWSKEIGLDSIEYFKFTHPDTIYRIVETDPDSVRQVAPFVVKNGEVLPVHVLYIDRSPVYFSQTDDVQRYSFKVDSGPHTIRIRTQKFEIVINNVEVPRFKKLILSVNADSLDNHSISIKSRPDTLTRSEMDVLNRYMIAVTPSFQSNMAYVNEGDRYFLMDATQYQYLYNQSLNGNLLIGPLKGANSNFHVVGSTDYTWFRPEAGYSFLFDTGFLKQTSLPLKYPFANTFNKRSTANTDYRQYAFTAKSVDSLWLNFLNSRTVSYNNNYYVQSRGYGQLTVEPDNRSKYVNARAIIIYKNNDPDFVSIYPANTTNLGFFEPGRYRIFYLYASGSYFLRDSVLIEGNGKNFYRLSGLKLHVKDQVSAHIMEALNNQNDGKTAAAKDNVQTIKESFNDKYLDDTELTDMVTGIVTDKKEGTLLPGVIVKLRGISRGTVTDMNGHFRLQVPARGTLEFRFIGYETKSIGIYGGDKLNVKLEAQSKELNEVVVVGYGVQTKRELTGAVSVITTLQGKVPGMSVMLRGNRSVEVNSKAVVILDGVIVPFDADTIDPALIASIQVLKSDAATALYGSSAAGGAVIITTKKAKDKTNETPSVAALSGYRKNFSDYAYWQPRLKTDEQGNASFKVTFPDDITNWRTFVIGMTGARQSGLAESQIKAYKPLSAALTTPLFAIKGDVLRPIGKVLNYTTDTIALKRKFSVNNTLAGERNMRLINAVLDTFNVKADGHDSLVLEYSITRDNGYFDGEKRSIPLFEQGTLETKGTFAALERDSTLTLTFDSKLGGVTFRAEASALPVLLDESRRLREYEYLCNEQLASKLIGLLAEKKIRKYLDEDFKYESHIRNLIKKLQESRRRDGLWGCGKIAILSFG